MRLLIYGVAGASIMAGIAMMRRARYERQRLRSDDPRIDDARRRLRRVAVAAWLCILCGTGMIALLVMR